LSFALLGAGVAAARADGDAPSLDRILPQIRERHPGKFYDAEGPWRGPDGQWRYRLKWMTPDGRIVWFDADARTGRVLGPDFETRGGRDVQQDERRMREEQQRFREQREQRRFERDERPWPRQDRPRGHRH
jgi:hypothetical protein